MFQTLKSFLFVTSLLLLATPGFAKNITAIWANDGGDKVRKEERRAALGYLGIMNSVWDGETIKVFGARNETVSFNLVLETGEREAQGVSIDFNRLTGPQGYQISSKRIENRDDIFNWVGRNIELFFVRYLKIEGLSQFAYQTYDERHVPNALRRPLKGDGKIYLDDKGNPVHGWKDRPGADQSFPDIAVPLELHSKFIIDPNSSQSIWADIYIPRSAPAGTYSGVLSVYEGASRVRAIPVQLQVRDFALPDVSQAKTMLYLGYEDVNERYLGQRSPMKDSPTGKDRLSTQIMDRHFLMAHRHRIALIDNNNAPGHWDKSRPRTEWIPRLDGSLFSPLYGYDGPGAFIGNGVFSIGTYGYWGWRTEKSMQENSNAWEKWFEDHFPDTERFLYLIDESKIFKQTEKWSKWLDSQPETVEIEKRSKHRLKSFATIALPEALEHVPSLDIMTSLITVGIADVWQRALEQVRGMKNKQFWMYNGKRPASGSFATEDDGVALRELAWGQFKMGVERWFYWEGTYYTDTQGGAGRTRLFSSARTIGTHDAFSPIVGMTGYQNSNGDGVLFYPGTDRVFPDESYEINGPIASLRLKHWRRGIQDVDYLALAQKVAPEKVKKIVQRMVPKILWENGVEDVNDPTYKYTDISWSIDPNDWEQARKELADIIEAGH